MGRKCGLYSCIFLQSIYQTKIHIMKHNSWEIPNSYMFLHRGIIHYSRIFPEDGMVVSKHVAVWYLSWNVFYWLNFLVDMLIKLCIWSTDFIAIFLESLWINIHYFRKRKPTAPSLCCRSAFQVQVNCKVLFLHFCTRRVSECYCKFVLWFTAEKPLLISAQ
jgi:hypothetical protein